MPRVIGLLEIATAVLFGGWFAVSLVGQVTPRQWSWREGPLRALIPDWRFFAPEPALEDRVLVYRTQSPDGAVTSLNTVQLQSTGALRWLWNPRVRSYKAVFDLVDGLRPRAPSREDGDTGIPDAVVWSEPYLSLLGVASKRARADGPGLVQFGILLRRWPDDAELIFLSRWHAIEAAQEDTRPY